MATVNKHQLIRAALMQRPDGVVDASIDLWERLASRLVSIIGEGGFQSLYGRSLRLTGATFPWVAAIPPLPQANGRFAELRTALEKCDPADVRDASTLLLITFIDILTLLIGELLTASILSSAWGDEAFYTAGKDLL
jgi:hypothetical protein